MPTAKLFISLLCFSLLTLSVTARPYVLVLSQEDFKDEPPSDPDSSPEWDEFGDFDSHKSEEDLDPGSWRQIFEPTSTQPQPQPQSDTEALYYSVVTKLMTGDARLIEEGSGEIETAAESGYPATQSVLGLDNWSVKKNKEDKFGGVILTVQNPMDSDSFASKLEHSMSLWTQQGKKGIWINLPLQHSNLVHSAVKAGFRYHHAESDYLMLVYWIPHTPDSIPANALHRLGVGAFVVNNKREVLVVQETSGRFGGTGVWKMPTGAVNEGEDICDAVIREVKEETGVETEFVEVLAFRQSHKSFFQKSDLFFVCMLQPQSFDIQSQASEIEATKWMPVEDYAAQPFVQENELFDFIAKICLSKLNDNYTGFSNVPTTTSSGKKTYLYLNNDAIGSHLLASKEQA
ncbi:unnamed protein product [Vicia faba]|uniref:Nudix hydrolase domain-containing protein n=1 Tax=Vicia faba TaxID=3906 RepID=A0AAV0ZL39_VICFA|nr:unnamed protein product [Vicia faba]